jgi:molybdopterin molybdotransferase
MPAPAHDDCSGRNGAGVVSFEAAREIAAMLATPLDGWEVVAVSAALGRTLAAPVRAKHPLPPFDQAAMDGYAVRLSGSEKLSRLLPIIGRTSAGDNAGVLAPNSAHRILTGAVLPFGADTVVMEEDATARGNLVQIDANIAAGTHVRRAGEDIAKGMTVLQRGCIIGWPEVALLSALGVERIAVVRPLRLAIVTTGSELRRPGEPLPHGTIHDSNGPMLTALFARPDIDITSLTVGDDLNAIARALAQTTSNADLIITTAGMSLSEEDHVCNAITHIGGLINIRGVLMKPGKRLTLGRLRDAIFVGLPGNPQAAAAGALALVRPMIARMLGQSAAKRLTASISFSFDGKTTRTELIPVILDSGNGRLIAHRCGPEGSHRLQPLVTAEALAIIPDTMIPAGAGAVVEILPFDQMRFRGSPADVEA